MAKTIYLCSKSTLPQSLPEQLFKICTKLTPDYITPVKPAIAINKNTAYGIMNPNSTITEQGLSLLMGKVFERNDKWNIPLERFPDGSYALFRNNDDYCEVVTDPVASRTIWYYHDDEIFIASTSQRAIVMYLGSFEFEERLIPWMLSSGTIGPDLSWDKRIRRIHADSSVILDKRNWAVTNRSHPVEFHLGGSSDEQNEILLREALIDTFKNLDLDYRKWILPLSGGYDSRGILCLLLETNPNNKYLKTVTWGLKSSLKKKGNDAYVARELAERLHMSNSYYANDLFGEPVEIVIKRFVLAGEGLIDNIADYLDGFNMWKKIYEDGVEGIIRGDEGFGCKPYSSALAARMNQGLTLCSDLSNLKDYLKYGFPLQELPQYLKQRKGETLSTWRDRLFHTHTLSVEFAALSDLKLSFVEQINPLLSKKILELVRQLPDHLRTGKSLFKKIVDSISPEINYAKNESSASLCEILKQEQIVSFIRSELSKDFAKTILPGPFLDFVLKGLETKAQKGVSIKPKSVSSRSYIGLLIPRFMKETLRTKIIAHSLDNNILAFRVLLICKMNEVLMEDKSACLYK